MGWLSPLKRGVQPSGDAHRSKLERLERNWRRVASTHTLQVGCSNLFFCGRWELLLCSPAPPCRPADQPSIWLIRDAIHMCTQDLLEADDPSKQKRGPNFKLLALGCACQRSLILPAFGVCCWNGPASCYFTVPCRTVCANKPYQLLTKKQTTEKSSACRLLLIAAGAASLALGVFAIVVSWESCLVLCRLGMQSFAGGCLGKMISQCTMHPSYQPPS